MVASCQSRGSHTLNHTLLYQLFKSKWDHNLQNGRHADHKPIVNHWSGLLLAIRESAGLRHFCIGFTFQTRRLPPLLLCSPIFAIRCWLCFAGCGWGCYWELVTGCLGWLDCGLAFRSRVIVWVHEVVKWSNINKRYHDHYCYCYYEYHWYCCYHHHHYYQHRSGSEAAVKLLGCAMFLQWRLLEHREEIMNASAVGESDQRLSMLLIQTHFKGRIRTPKTPSRLNQAGFENILFF